MFLGLLCLPVLVTACDQDSKPVPRAERTHREATQQPLPMEQADKVTPSRTSTSQTADNQKVLPLSRILEIVRRDTPGEILEVEEDDDDDLLTYEVQILTPDDRKIEIKLNAYTGAIIERDEE